MGGTPGPNRGIGTKGFPAFENCNETCGHGGQRPMDVSTRHPVAAERINRLPPEGGPGVAASTVPLY